MPVKELGELIKLLLPHKSPDSSITRYQS
jgi:hypothetical protein